jgi:hypothetical protein
MADQTPGGTGTQRRRVSVIGFLAVASVGFTGDPWWLLNEATKWVVAGVVALVGIGLLATALPGRQRKNLS